MGSTAPREVTIAGRKVGLLHRTFVVAEISANHDGELAKALRLIDAAHGAGADAVKFQLFEPDDLVPADAPWTLTNGPWAGRRYRELYETARTPRAWLPDLFQHARGMGVIPLCSVFARWAVDALEQLDCAAYKIASLELGESPLVAYAAATGKPLILSAPMERQSVIGGTLVHARTAGDGGIVLLHCVAAYPAPVASMNLRRIALLAHEHGVVGGLSDHSAQPLVAELAVALGASVIEAHLMLPRPNHSLDAAFSLDPQEFKDLVAGVRLAEEMAALRPDAQQAVEEASVGKLRRRWCAARDLAAGHMLSRDDVRTYRAPDGIPASAPAPTGRVLAATVQAGTPLTPEVLR